MSMPRGMRACAAAATIAAILAACTPALTERPQAKSPIVVRPAFELTGRLSARHGNDALAAGFHWTHERGRDELDLSNPLGQTIARLSGDAAGVRLQSSEGRIETASDWAFWIQGVPREGAPATVEAGTDGMPVSLRQDGWNVGYQAFERGADGVSRPKRLTLEYPEVELRIAVDAWR